MTTSYTNKFCVIIPTYNHYKKLGKLISDIENIAQNNSINLPIILVNDASNYDCEIELNKISQASKTTTLVTNSTNCGKGGAVKVGFFSSASLRRLMNSKKIITTRMCRTFAP